MVSHFQNWRAALVGVFIGALLVGGATRPASEVQAEVRRATPAEPEQHFKSGGRLSESVLQDILVVLKRIDDRLARIESASTTRGAAIQSTPTADSGPASTADRDVPEIKVRRGR